MGWWCTILNTKNYNIPSKGKCYSKTTIHRLTFVTVFIILDKPIKQYFNLKVLKGILANHLNHRQFKHLQFLLHKSFVSQQKRHYLIVFLFYTRKDLCFTGKQYVWCKFRSIQHFWFPTNNKISALIYS